jgi:hypothetical protein
VLCRLYSSTVQDLPAWRESVREAFVIGDGEIPRGGKIFSYFDSDTIVEWSGDAPAS